MKLYLAAIVVMALLGGGLAHAETQAETLEARKAFVRGDAAFKANQFDEALTEFERGYELSRRPRFLLNIAHTQRKLGRMREALAGYRRFLLTDPKPNDRELANEMVAEIEALLAQEDALHANAQPLPTTPPPAASKPWVAPAPVVLDAKDEDEEASPIYKRWPFWAGVGAVVVVGVVAAVMLSGGNDNGQRSGSWGELRL